MKIDAIHCLRWKIGLPSKELENAGWEIGANLPGCKEILIFTAEGEFGHMGKEGLFPEIKYFSIGTASGKITAHTYKDWEHLLSIIQKVIADCGHAKPFGAIGDDPYLLSALIFQMGWASSGDDVFLLPGYELAESDLWLDASKIKNKLAKHPDNTLVVHRETWRGEADIALADIRGMKGIASLGEFEPDDRVETVRVCYRNR